MFFKKQTKKDKESTLDKISKYTFDIAIFLFSGIKDKTIGEMENYITGIVKEVKNGGSNELMENSQKLLDL
jgi:hypothetical protein